MPVRSATLIQISGTSTPSRSRQAIIRATLAEARFGDKTFGVRARAVLARALAGIAAQAAPRTRVVLSSLAAWRLRAGSRSASARAAIIRRSRYDADGRQLAGFDVAVARAYASDRGRPLELVAFRWPDLDARLAAGDFDVAMSGVTVRGDRLARSPDDPCGRARGRRAGRAERGRPPATRPAPSTVAVNRGGHLERVARALACRARRSSPSTTTEPARRAPRAGEVDGVVTDTLELQSFDRARRVRDRARAGARAGSQGVLGRAGQERSPTTSTPGSRARGGRHAAAAARAVLRHGRRRAALAGPERPRCAWRPGRSPAAADARGGGGEARGRPADRRPGARGRPSTPARGEAALRDGLAPEPYADLVRAQVEAAKVVQRAVLARDAASARRRGPARRRGHRGAGESTARDPAPPGDRPHRRGDPGGAGRRGAAAHVGRAAGGGAARRRRGAGIRRRRRRGLLARALASVPAATPRQSANSS